MVQRKRLKRKSTPAEPEQKGLGEFATKLTEYRDLQQEIDALEASIAEELSLLTKRRDQAKAEMTEILEKSDLKKMETSLGTVTLVRPTRHSVDEDLLKERLSAKTWKEITTTTTKVDQSKFEAALVDGKIDQALFQEAVKEVPANKGHTKVTLAKAPAPDTER